MQYISNISVFARNLSILANFSYLNNFRYNCKITFLSVYPNSFTKFIRMYAEKF